MKKLLTILALFSTLTCLQASNDDDFKEEDIPKILPIIKDGTKDMLPMMLDDYTTLVDIVSLNNAIEYRNRINNANPDVKAILSGNKDSLIKTTFENNRNYLCNDSETRMLLKKGAIFIYLFNDLNETELFKFSVQYKDCP